MAHDNTPITRKDFTTFREDFAGFRNEVSTGMTALRKDVNAVHTDVTEQKGDLTDLKADFGDFKKVSEEQFGFLAEALDTIHKQLGTMNEDLDKISELLCDDEKVEPEPNATHRDLVRSIKRLERHTGIAA